MRIESTFFALGWLVACAVFFPVSAADYAGTFKGHGLTVIFAPAQEGYSGTIQMGDKKFPCTAQETSGQLRGTFNSDGNQFEFKATIAGSMLTLESGGTVYTLERQSVPVNPLARPEPVSPLAEPAPDTTEKARQSLPTERSSKTSFIRFKRVSVTDRPDMIGGEAFSFLAPADWQVDGGLVWRLHPTMPAAVAMRVSNPAGLEQLECFPTVAFSWGGYLPVSGFPQGSTYLGNEVQPPLRDALAYLRERHLPRVRSSVKATIVKSEALPKLAEAARMAEPIPPGGPTAVFTAGRLRIEYEINGKPVEEDLYCVLNSMALPGSNMTIEIADKLYGLRAPKGRLDETTKLFETTINSTRINIQWFNRYAQLVQSLTQAQMNQIRAAGELSRIISRTSNEISDMMHQSYEERQAAQDRINKNWDQYMRGVDEYHDPIAGRPVELPSGYRNAWASGNGEYIVTESADFNPNVELGGTWQKLERREQ
jgi:hypothetical protein